MKRCVLALAMLLALLAGLGSSSAIAQEGDEQENPPPACAAALKDDATPVAMEEGEELPAWQTVELTNALTGETFTIADYAGCTVMVETMATWCPNCKKQLTNVAAAREELDADQTVFIAISVETELKPEDLQAYAEENGFDWVFAVASVDMLKAIEEAFGRDSLVPPSTPHVVVQADGTFGDLITGITSPEDIVELMSPDSGEE